MAVGSATLPEINVSTNQLEACMPALLLWLLGVPIPIIILIALLVH